MNPSGRLEFREALGRSCLLAAIHGFQPRLPWPVYVLTQALAHLAVMRGFGGHLRRVPAGSAGLGSGQVRR